MKKLTVLTLLLAGLVVGANASASWFDSDNNECWYNPYNCNPYDPWDPRYWFEEMEDFFNDNDDYYGYGGGYGYPPRYPMAPPYMPYPMAPNMPAPYTPAAPGYLPRSPYAAPPAPPAPPKSVVPQAQTPGMTQAK